MLCNYLELLVNRVLLLFGVAIIVLQNHRMQGCHFLITLTNQTLNGIYGSHRMAFVVSMHELYFYMQIPPMKNIESNHFVDG